MWVERTAKNRRCSERLRLLSEPQLFPLSVLKKRPFDSSCVLWELASETSVGSWSEQFLWSTNKLHQKKLFWIWLHFLNQTLSRKTKQTKKNSLLFYSVFCFIFSIFFIFFCFTFQSSPPSSACFLEKCLWFGNISISGLRTTCAGLRSAHVRAPPLAKMHY